MRWPFGPPHLTLNPPKKNKQKKNKKKQNKKQHKKKPKKKQNKEKVKNTKIPKTELFSLSVKIFFFWQGIQKLPFFDTLAQKTRTQKHYKHRGFSLFFLERSYASRNGHFWKKKPKFRNSSYHYFLAFFLFQKQKTPKLAETTIL